MIDLIIPDMRRKINSLWGETCPSLDNTPPRHIFFRNNACVLTAFFRRDRVRKIICGRRVSWRTLFPSAFMSCPLYPRGARCNLRAACPAGGKPPGGRIVGAVMARAPAGLPCHRVLYRDGSLCCERAFGGKAVQRQLLEREGVPFLPDGRVDLRLCLWQPAAPGCEFRGE